MDEILVFFYIESEEKHFINRQGFNFTPYYTMEINEDNGKKRLSIINKKIYGTWYKRFYDPAVSVTAIVGKNGSGKTTLLKELSQLVKRTGHPRLMVLKEGANLVCYHTLDDFECLDRHIKVYNLLNDSDYKICKKDKLGPFAFSILSFTNSQYGCIEPESPLILNSGELEGNDYFERIDLNIHTLDALAHTYYVNKMKPQAVSNGGYNSFIVEARNSIKGNRFQQLLDVNLYTEAFLIENNGESYESLRKWYQPKIHLSFVSYFDYIKENIYKRSLQKHPDDYDKLVENANNIIISISEQIDTTHNVVDILWKNLIFEILLKTKNNIELVKNIRKVISIKKSLEKTVEVILENESFKRNYSFVYKDVSRYQGEIKGFFKIVKNSKISQNPIPSITPFFEVDFNKKESEILLRYIHGIINDSSNTDSFIIRYIHLSNLTFSSGERAMLNLYSWVRLASSASRLLREKGSSTTKDLNDNILLLIDEIDLYLHPEWNRKIVCEVINSCKELFHGKKVSIVFSTQNPIELSDMPKGNVIYLSTDHDRHNCVVDNNEIHKETFGSPIYNLYKDAFFIGNNPQIGEFSYGKIQDIINDLSDILGRKKKKFRKSEYEQKISMIGDPVLKNQLKNLLELCIKQSEQ